MSPGRRGRWLRPRVATAAVAACLWAAKPADAFARRPDPGIATLLSVGATLLPLTAGALLLLTGDGVNEDPRVAAGLTSVALGASVGPSVGTLYAGGQDAWATLLLRTATTGLMTTGLGYRLEGAAGDRDLGLALAILGAVPTAALAAWDVANAGRLARQTRRQSGFAGAIRAGPPPGPLADWLPGRPGPGIRSPRSPRLRRPGLRWRPSSPRPRLVDGALRPPDAG